jgi:DNA helicase II / ATP-dependent DNA helicase PcrA
VKEQDMGTDDGSSADHRYDLVLTDADAPPEDPYDSSYDSSYDSPYDSPYDSAGMSGPAAVPEARTPDPRRVEALLAGLNPSQRDAVTYGDGPLLVVAGPGSGKTRVLTHRVAMLLERGVAPWQLLVVTFTNKAAAELRERMVALVGEATAQRLWVSTFHAACARILRSHGEKVGLPRGFSIFDTSDTSRIVRDLLTVSGVAPDKDEVKAVRSELSRVKNDLGTPATLAASSYAADRQFADTLAAYNQRLRDLGGVDFDDLLGLTVQLLSEQADVRAAYQQRFVHVLVDEYQDTNATQARLVQLLAAPHNNVSVVGDAQQSIYSWRGAQPAVMRTFSDQFAGASTVMLSHNYRSTEAILEVVRAIVEPVKDELVPSLVCAQDPSPTDDPVRLVYAGDERDEASWVVSDLFGRSGSTAVLMRTNAQSRVFEEELVTAGVSYQVVGALRFYDRAEIKDALAYLRVMINPKDAVSFARCVNTPRRGLGPTSVSWLVEAAERDGVDLVTAARDANESQTAPKRMRAGLASFVAALDVVEAGLALSPGDAVEAVAGPVGLREALESDRSNPDRSENLDELVTSARQFVLSPQQAGRTPAEQALSFLENVALVSAADLDAEEADERAAQVQLLTVHAAKGREFDVVYVVGVEQELFPHVRSVTSEQVAEERRLLFVACSRARATLTLSWAASRYLFADRKDRSPSPFLTDLPESVVTVRTLKSTMRPGGRSSGRAGDRWRSSGVSSRAGSWASATAAPGAGSRSGSGPGSWSGSGSGRSGASPAGSRSPAPPVSADRLSVSQATVGVVVSHPRFGAGTVEALNGDRVTVAFADGPKTLDLRFAPLSLSGT